MSVLESFSDFSKRVLKAVKGRLASSDQILLEHLMVKTNQRNVILARGILSSLNTGSPKKEDIASLARILDTANLKIMNKKEPFGESEKTEIAKIFSKYGLSKKVSDWMSSQKDIFLYSEINIMAKKDNLKELPRAVRVEQKKQQNI